ncbi:MAG: [FeFe] hydrogenase H-cluster radical SAM maturase HydE [Eubacteriales bacterium]|nr:[FeFe] hydrogenase H-cluster radical SAM maturase HydE [Eubacteriales bacterium]
MTPDRDELIRLLALEDFTPVYARADAVRRESVGDTVHIRAILEFSNYCRRQCRYCGLNRNNRTAHRFRMTPEEMLATARAAHQAGYRTLVMQSGEDPWYTKELLGEVVKEITSWDMVVTLSVGERPHGDFAYWKQCGATRYLLKHETADPVLYDALHPCGTLEARVGCLRALKALGYETGSGFMIGLPGQTLSTIADDLLLLKDIGCDMAGIGPFIPHPATPLAHQSAGDPALATRAVALARLLLPAAHLPATTSLGVLDDAEKQHVFSCGANVIMKKVTPDAYKTLYEIYPAQLGHTDIPAERRALEQQIRALGRNPL